MVDGDGDTIATIDMGAFEFHFAGDLNQDGQVSGLDLAILLAQWGACQTPLLPSCSGDLNGDGHVSGLDLAMLLGAWAR